MNTKKYQVHLKAANLEERRKYNLDVMVASNLIKQIPIDQDLRDVIILTNDRHSFYMDELMPLDDIVDMDHLPKKVVWADDLTDASSMFESFASVKNVDLTEYDLSKIKNMNDMFSTCESLEVLDITGCSTANVESFIGTFEHCKNLKEIKGVLDLSSCKSARYMRNMFSSTAYFEMENDVVPIKIKNPPKDFTSHDASGRNEAALYRNQYEIVE